MAHIVRTHVDDATPSGFPPLAGVSPAGKVTTTPIVAAADRPLFLWQHALARDGELRWQRPAQDHALFVWEGSAELKGTVLPKHGMVIVEHGAEATLKAGKDGAKLLHFYRPEEPAGVALRPGGTVHLVEKGHALHYQHKFTEGFVYADSSCPTCALWFHRSEYGPSHIDRPLARHFHTEDEIIFITDGSMRLGNREISPGTALAIDANTIYSFKIGHEGLGFVNFRARESDVIVVGREGRSKPINERQMSYDLAARTFDVAAYS
jgi:hypothetical protein